MSIHVKNAQEIEYMRTSCRILAEVLEKIRPFVKPGISTGEIDKELETMIASYPEVTPGFKGYHGYPAVSCINVNEEVVHTIPGNRILNPGDLVSVDCGVIYKGFYSDACIAIALAPVTPEINNFVKTAYRALANGIAAARPGNHIGDISAAIQKTIEPEGYTISKEFTGHGIGRTMHEEPHVPNLGKKGSGPALIPGMTLAIEPIFMLGDRKTKTLSDKWSVVTVDDSWAIQVEKTILITASGAEILTKMSN